MTMTMSKARDSDCEAVSATDRSSTGADKNLGMLKGMSLHVSSCQGVDLVHTGSHCMFLAKCGVPVSLVMSTICL